MTRPASGVERRRIIFVTGNAGKLREVEEGLNGVAGLQLTARRVEVPEVQGRSVAEVSRAKAIAAYQQLFSQLNQPRSPNKKSESQKERTQDCAVLVEDTGLGFDALGGLPGPYVKWFLDALGAEKLARLADGLTPNHIVDARGNPHNRNDPTVEDNNRMRDRPNHAKPNIPSAPSGPPSRAATAVCVFSLCEGFDLCTTPSTGGEPALRVVQFEGVCPGQLVDVRRGGQGFGWDGVFVPNMQPAPGARTFAEMSLTEKNQISHRARALAKLREYLGRGQASPVEMEEEKCVGK